MAARHPTYRFPPPERRQVVGSLTAAQLALLASALIVAVFGIARPHPTPAGVGAALLLVVAVAVPVLVPVRGRLLTEWAPISCRHLAQRLAGGSEHRAVPTLGLLSAPSEVGDIELLAFPADAGELGVAAERRAGRYTAVLAVEGAPPFLLEEAGRQQALLGRWGGLLARLADAGTPLHRLQWVTRVLPDQAHAPAAYFQRHRASSLGEASAVVRSYIELLRTAATSSVAHRTVLAVQVAAGEIARPARQAGGGDRGACTVLERVVRLVAAELTDLGVERPRPLSARELRGWLRVAFDPAAGYDLDRLAHAHPQLGWGSAAAWPSATSTSWSSYRSCERAWHRSFTLLLPSCEVGANWLVPLLVEGDACRTVAMTLRGVPREQAARQARRALTAAQAEEARKQRVGQLHTSDDERRATAAAERMRELTDGHAVVVFAATVTVSATDPDALEQACDQVHQLAATSACELVALDGQQAQAFTWTLPLARGL